MSIIQTLLAHVNQILADPDSRAALNNRIDEFAAQSGTSLGDNDHAGLCDLSQAYVLAVVELIGESDRAAFDAGIAPFAAPILQTAVNYFLQPHDYIPDQQGLYGLLDDSYLACRFIARMSQMVQADRGFPLLDTSLDQHSPIIRVLIGEPLATQLDQEIETTLANVLAQLQMAQAQALHVQPGAAMTDMQRWDRVHQNRAINDEARLMAIASGDLGF